MVLLYKLLPPSNLNWLWLWLGLSVLSFTFQVSVLLPARLVFPLGRESGGAGAHSVTVESVALFSVRLSVRGQESIQTLCQATRHQYFKLENKLLIFFKINFEIFIWLLCREEQESDISSQYDKTSPKTERTSTELKNTVVRLHSPSFSSSNFLTVSFARQKPENISLRVIQSGLTSGGEENWTENKRKDLMERGKQIYMVGPSEDILKPFDIIFQHKL